MSITFFDGFDFYNQSGQGGRKWDQGFGVGVTGGRFGGQSVILGTSLVGGYGAYMKTLARTAEMIVGFAIKVDAYDGILFPFLTFFDGNTPQCSIWIDDSTKTIKVMTGLGTQLTDYPLGDTGFVPPLTLWFYIEVKVLIGNPGAVEIHVNGQSIATFTGIQTQQTGNASFTKIGLSGEIPYSHDSIFIDDLYVVDTQDSVGYLDFLGEVRVQTKYPDADGFQTDFLRSTGTVNAQNANVAVTDYAEHGIYNFSGAVGAKDLYSIGNFTISGTIFAVQENLSFRKDDVGNRSIAPIMRTASTLHTGTSVSCYSDYTYTGKIWENNPHTLLPWTLTDLNSAEFGITVTA